MIHDPVRIHPGKSSQKQFIFGILISSHSLNAASPRKPGTVRAFHLFFHYGQKLTIFCRAWHEIRYTIYKKASICLNPGQFGRSGGVVIDRNVYVVGRMS
tara:strand:+ start:233 stop:532 length:300 start_codon:yes stop_codon:yes gene_type:complete